MMQRYVATLQFASVLQFIFQQSAESRYHIEKKLIKFI
jgi:hypothetical protein